MRMGAQRGKQTTTLMLGMGFFFATQVVLAEAPRVKFDVTPVLACYDVTTEADAVAHPDEDVIEVAYQVSVQLRAGSERDIDELLVEITNPDRRLRILDFSPRTQLENRIEGTVEVKTTDEDVDSLGISLGGQVKLPLEGLSVGMAPNANIGTTRRNVVTETKNKIPAKHLVLASGTVDQGRGVFFKLKPSLDGTFEGQKEFVCRYAVPHGWRGDWTIVRCRASGRVKHLLTSSIEECGREQTYVGLYRAGDLEAKLAARQLSAAQEYARQLQTSPPKPSLLPWLVPNQSQTKRERSRASITAARRALSRMAAQEHLE